MQAGLTNHSLVVVVTHVVNKVVPPTLLLVGHSYEDKTRST